MREHKLEFSFITFDMEKILASIHFSYLEISEWEHSIGWWGIFGMEIELSHLLK